MAPTGKPPWPSRRNTEVCFVVEGAENIHGRCGTTTQNHLNEGQVLFCSTLSVVAWLTLFFLCVG